MLILPISISVCAMCNLENIICRAQHQYLACPCPYPCLQHGSIGCLGSGFIGRHPYPNPTYSFGIPMASFPCRTSLMACSFAAHVVTNFPSCQPSDHSTQNLSVALFSHPSASVPKFVRSSLKHAFQCCLPQLPPWHWFFPGDFVPHMSCLGNRCAFIRAMHPARHILHFRKVVSIV